MFNSLKRCLGIETLEEEMNFYRQQWTQILEGFLAINDHLAEIKERLKEYDEKVSDNVHDHHIAIMARLGMVLTAIDKLSPVQAVPRDSLDVFPLRETSPLKPVRQSRRVQENQ